MTPTPRIFMFSQSTTLQCTALPYTIVAATSHTVLLATIFRLAYTPGLGGPGLRIVDRRSLTAHRHLQQLQDGDQADQKGAHGEQIGASTPTKL